MYIYIYIYMYMYMYIYIYINPYMYTDIYTLYIYGHICIRIYIGRSFVIMNATDTLQRKIPYSEDLAQSSEDLDVLQTLRPSRRHLHTCTHIHVHIYIHTYMHTYIYIFLFLVGHLSRPDKPRVERRSAWAQQQVIAVAP